MCNAHKLNMLKVHDGVKNVQITILTKCLININNQFDLVWFEKTAGVCFFIFKEVIIILV